MSATQPSQRETIGIAAGKLVKSPGFMVAGLILLGAAFGLNYATAKLSLNFKKEAVPLRKAVAELPAKLGPWLQVSKDEPLSGDIEHVLGTEKYIFRDYVDTRRVPAAQLAMYEGKSAAECNAITQQIRTQDPKAVMHLSFTYYTGMVDTVAHIPERCFTADGNQSTYEAWPRLKVPGTAVDTTGYKFDAGGMRLSQPGVKAEGPDAGVPVRQLLFEDQDNRAAGVKVQSVSYVFHVNGRYEANALGVRQSLQNLLEKRGYYAKVEMLTLLKDPAEAAAVNADFLSSALPEIEKCLPDWAAK